MKKGNSLERMAAWAKRRTRVVTHGRNKGKTLTVYSPQLNTLDQVRMVDPMRTDRMNRPRSKTWPRKADTPKHLRRST